MSSYASAAVATYESGGLLAIEKWLQNTSHARHIQLFLIDSKGDIIGSKPFPDDLKRIQGKFVKGNLPNGLFRTDNMLISRTIASDKSRYRLVAKLKIPLGELFQLEWSGLGIRIIVSIIISGLICYLLSIYLTKPLRKLGQAAKALAHGRLNTRVGAAITHRHDEIAELAKDFDNMAENIELLVDSKQRLLQDISHELRSPLARLQLSIELARKKTNGLAVDEFNRMELETQRLNELIGEVLALAKLNKYQYPMYKEQCDLEALLKGIIDDANFEFGQAIPRVKLAHSESIEANFDKKLIHRAIENIVRNALRYSPDDTSVIINLEKDDEQNIHISITDYGHGVPEDDLEKIFAPFYRVDTSREKRTGGYGLGLAIASKAIALHKGKITAENIAQGGLCVRLSFPQG